MFGLNIRNGNMSSLVLGHGQRLLLRNFLHQNIQALTSDVNFLHSTTFCPIRSVGCYLSDVIAIGNYEMKGKS